MTDGSSALSAAVQLSEAVSAAARASRSTAHSCRWRSPVSCNPAAQRLACATHTHTQPHAHAQAHTHTHTNQTVLACNQDNSRCSTGIVPSCPVIAVLCGPRAASSCGSLQAGSTSECHDRFPTPFSSVR